MSHSSRLNILTCVAKKPYHELFSHFLEKNKSEKKSIYDYKGDIPFHHAVTNRLTYPDGSNL